MNLTKLLIPWPNGRFLSWITGWLSSLNHGKIFSMDLVHDNMFEDGENPKRFNLRWGCVKSRQQICQRYGGVPSGYFAGPAPLDIGGKRFLSDPDHCPVLSVTSKINTSSRGSVGTPRETPKIITILANNILSKVKNWEHPKMCPLQLYPGPMIPPAKLCRPALAYWVFQKEWQK